MKPSDRYLITLRPGSIPAEPDSGKSGEIEELPIPDWSGLKGRRFLEYLEAALEDVDIAAADILVSIGRGIGKPENIPIAQDFADAIGATLACSRPVADKEWLPKSRQVGTSGKTVRPKIYLALGISGAFQHQAGMKNSGTIIAVNKDPKAPIFNVAHYGIVADLFQVLPVLQEKFAK
jgi:electron transfer flavoprotein alpha subunit